MIPCVSWGQDIVHVPLERVKRAPTVAALATPGARDGDLIQLEGYYASQDGGGQTLVYDRDSSATVDGGFVFNGPGGVGRYLATDTSVANIRRFGAKGTGSDGDATANVTAIEAAIAAIPADGGTLFFPDGEYKINDTIDLIDRKQVTVLGYNTPEHRDDGTGGRYGACLITTPSYGATKAVFNICSSSGAADIEDINGGIRFEGVAIKMDANQGYGIHVHKHASDTTFWGDISIANCLIRGGNIGLFLEDATGQGYGMLYVKNSRIEGNNYNARSTTTINIATFRDCVLRHAHLTGSGNFVTRTGGAIVWGSGSVLKVTGCDLEGSQVGVQSAARNTEISNNYFESMTDCSVSLSGVQDAVINNNYMPADATGAPIIYAYNCNKIRQANNNSAYFILAPLNRSVETDTPQLTRFSTLEDHVISTVNDKGMMLFPIPSSLAKFPAHGASSLQAISSNTATDVDKVDSTVLGPFGERQHVARITSTVGGNIEPTFGTITVAEGDFVVITMLLHAPTANPSANVCFLRFRENGADAWQNTLTTQVEKGKWFVACFIKKILAGDGTSYVNPSVRIYPVDVGDSLDVAYVACHRTRTPFINPVATHVFDSADSQIDLGNGRFLNSAVPTRGRWSLRDIIENDEPASAEPTSWRVTTAGGLAAAWGATTAYRVGQRVLNDTNKIYVCTVAGTSAGSGGPTGTGSGITDGTVTWNYAEPLAVITAGPAIP